MTVPHADYLLTELRCAALRARLWANEIDAMGCALRAGLVGPEEAIAAVAHSGALHLLHNVVGERA